MIAPLLVNTAAANTLAQIHTLASADNAIAAATSDPLAQMSASALSRIENGGVSSQPISVRPSGRSWTQRLISGAAGLVLGALMMQGCTFNPGGLAPLPQDAGTDTGDGSGGSDASDSGTGGDGGTDAGTLAVGPSALRPTMGQILPATRAFLLWQDGEIPSGRTVADYNICSTSGPASDIDDDNECPNSATVLHNYGVLDPLPASSTLRWKVRARFDNGTASQYSPIQSFQVDNSLTGWWRLDEGVGVTAGDSGSLGNNGTLQNPPTWTPGFLGQALTFGSQQVSVPNAPSLNFNGDFSLSAWVRSNSTGAHQAILYKGIYSLYKQDTGLLSFFTPGCGIVVSAGDVTPSVWHHAMVRRTGTTVRLYLDGQMTGMGNCTENLTNSAALAMGCVPGTPCTEPFDGIIDDAVATNASTADPLNDFCAGQVSAGVASLPAPCLP